MREQSGGLRWSLLSVNRRTGRTSRSGRDSAAHLATALLDRALRRTGPHPAGLHRPDHPVHPAAGPVAAPRSQVVSPSASVPLDAQIATARRHVDSDDGSGRRDASAVAGPLHPGRLPAAEEPAVGERTSPRSSSTPIPAITSDNATNSTGWWAGPTSCTSCSATTGRPSLPSLGHLIAPPPTRCLDQGRHRQPPIEMAAVWVLVLAATGIYLWWPRAIERESPGWPSGGPRAVGSGGEPARHHRHPGLGRADLLHRLGPDLVAVLG